MILEHKKYGVKNIIHPEQVHELITKAMVEFQPFDRDKECVFVIGLTRANTIKYLDLASIGCLTSAVVEPREVYRHAIVRAVANIVLVHTHPSGNAKPSENDKVATKSLFDAGNIIQIKLIDHIIVTEKEWYSFANEGLLW